MGQYRNIDRRKDRQIHVGRVAVGGGAPIAVQAMTTAPTGDADATLAQIRAFEAAGVDIVRLSCPDEESLRALRRVAAMVSLPLIVEIPLRGSAAAEVAATGAACLAIRPDAAVDEREIRDVVRAAREHGCALHLAVGEQALGAGILEKYGEPCPEAMVDCVLGHIGRLEDADFSECMISFESADMFLAVESYRRLARACPYPLQLDSHETGEFRRDVVNGSMGMGTLLLSGIGDSVRMALPGDPVRQVTVGFDMLKALGLRHRGVTIISCPSCSRQQFQVIETVERLEQRLAHITTPMTLSVIGCVVNGPGEARQTDIGLTGGGKGTHMVYINGVPDHRTKDVKLFDHIVELVEKKAEELDAERLREQADGLRAAAREAGGGGQADGSEVAELAVVINHVFKGRESRVVWDSERHADTYERLTGRRDTGRAPHRLARLVGDGAPAPAGASAAPDCSPSTAISTTLGMAVASGLNERPGHYLAVIRKEALSAGLTYEAMNNAGALGARMIVILVDDSDPRDAAVGVGAISAYLSRLISSRPYLSLRDISMRMLEHFPKPVTTAARRAEEYARGLATGGTLFEELGFYYVGLVDGTRLDHLLPVLRNLRDAKLASPVLLHVIVKRDREADEAAGAAAKGRAGSAAPETGTPGPVARALIAAAESDRRVVAVATAGPDADLAGFAERFPERYYTVGNADQHAAQFAVGLCGGGYQPFVVLDAASLPRALANVAHDLAPQRLPVRFVVAGAAPNSIGLGDLPGFVVMTAANADEFMDMAAGCAGIDDRPTLLCCPPAPADAPEAAEDAQPLTIGRGRQVRQGDDVAVVSFGPALTDALAAADQLSRLDVSASVVDGRFAQPLDRELLLRLAASHQAMVIVEDAAVGGIAGQVMLELAQAGALDGDLKVRTIGPEVPEAHRPAGRRRAPREMPLAQKIVDGALEALGRRIAETVRQGA